MSMFSQIAALVSFHFYIPISFYHLLDLLGKVYRSNRRTDRLTQLELKHRLRRLRASVKKKSKLKFDKFFFLQTFTFKKYAITLKSGLNLTLMTA